MNQPVLTVSALTRKIKELLENSFPRLWVEGEISNLKLATSGHLYFTLKDADSQISCAMWRSRAGMLVFQPENGMKVIVEGDLQVYERGGNYQLIVQQIQPAGLGSLQAAFEALKRRLNKEGLFDPAHKQPLPDFPQRVGVVTSPTGAAIRDIISVMRRRQPGVEIILYPVRVQGEGAAGEIARAIEDFNQFGEVDVLIVGRGGGSLEDLWAFNEEIVARAIYASRIPIVSAVGHEIDFSIADFVADRRAATPSAAAELVVRDRGELQGQLNYYREKFAGQLQSFIEERRTRLKNLRSGYGFRRPQDLIYQSMQRLDELQRSMQMLSRHHIDLKRSGLGNLQRQIAALNPEAVLNRGYSICYKNGTILKDAAAVSAGDHVKVRLAKGEFGAQVERNGVSE